MKKKLYYSDNATAYPIQSFVAFAVVAIMIAFYFVGIHGTFVSHESNGIDISAKATDVAERLLSDPGEAVGLGVNWENGPKNISALGLCAVHMSFVSHDVLSSVEGYIVQGAYYGNFFNYSKDSISDRLPRLLRPPNVEPPSVPPPGWWLPPERFPTRVGEIKGIRYENIDNIIDFPNENGSFYELNNNFPYAILDARKISNLTNIDYNLAREALGIDDSYDFNVTIINNTGAKILSYGKLPGSGEAVSVCTRNVLVRYIHYDSNNNPVYTYEPAQMTVRIF